MSCGSRPHCIIRLDGPPGPRAVPSFSPVPTLPRSLMRQHTVPFVGLRVEIVVAREVALSEPVPITLRIVNTGARPLELHLQGRTATFDLVVRRGDAVVWQRLENATV